MIMEAAVSLFIARTGACKTGFLGTLVFRESVLRFPYKADENLGILYAVLNNLPVPVLISSNEYWQYWIL